MTGETAENSVNVDTTKSIGQNILKDMTDKPVSEVTFKKNKQAVAMASSCDVKIRLEVIHVDPHSCSKDSLLLFKRTPMHWKLSSNINLPASQHLCLIGMDFLEKPTNTLGQIFFGQQRMYQLSTSTCKAHSGWRITFAPLALARGILLQSTDKHVCEPCGQ